MLNKKNKKNSSVPSSMFQNNEISRKLDLIPTEGSKQVVGMQQLWTWDFGRLRVEEEGDSGLNDINALVWKKSHDFRLY